MKAHCWSVQQHSLPPARHWWNSRFYDDIRHLAVPGNSLVNLQAKLPYVKYSFFLTSVYCHLLVTFWNECNLRSLIGQQLLNLNRILSIQQIANIQLSSSFSWTAQWDKYISSNEILLQVKKRTAYDVTFYAQCITRYSFIIFSFCKFHHRLPYQSSRLSAQARWRYGYFNLNPKNVRTHIVPHSHFWLHNLFLIIPSNFSLPQYPALQLYPKPSHNSMSQISHLEEDR